jgi:acyl CoA:acetate/3-ketoacid CoA transferase beta subunit
MAQYIARLMDAETGAEGKYPFEAGDLLMEESPVRIVRTFMEHVDKKLFPKQHVDYELNAAFKSIKFNVVTALGALEFEDDEPVPFTLMISPY